MGGGGLRPPAFFRPYFNFCVIYGKGRDALYIMKMLERDIS